MRQIDCEREREKNREIERERSRVRERERERGLISNLDSVPLVHGLIDAGDPVLLAPDKGV